MRCETRNSVTVKKKTQKDVTPVMRVLKTDTILKKTKKESSCKMKCSVCGWAVKRAAMMQEIKTEKET